MTWSTSPLHAICDAEACQRAGWTVFDLACACLGGGAQVLQIRAKTASSRWLFDTVLAVVERARSANALVIVNDRPDIAWLTAAGGVHVGQDDLAPSLVRSVVGEASNVGLSTHAVDQVRHAVAEPVSYVAIGPVFGTVSKETGYEAIGLGTVREAAVVARAKKLPLVAIGGITLERAPAVVEAGADAVAVISDLLATGNPEARVKALLAALG